MTPPTTPFPRWIPVGERLPESQRAVIATVVGKYAHSIAIPVSYKATFVGQFCVGKFFTDIEDGEIFAPLGDGKSVYVTAWMPLPSPYDETSESVRELKAKRTEAGDRRDWDECDRLEADLKRLGLKDS